MKLTKDEARILAAVLSDFKFRLNDDYCIEGLFLKLENLEAKLENFGKDKRRNGRASQDSWSDLVKRFSI